MRLFFISLLLVAGFEASAAEPVLKFTLTKANGTPAVYEFFVPAIRFMDKVRSVRSSWAKIKRQGLGDGFF